MLAILHIGVEKTGTTSIQEFLRLNRSTLKDLSILYPQSPGSSNHTALALYAAADDKCDDLRIGSGIARHDDLPRFRDQFAADFSRELNEASCETVILSGEHCSSRLTSRDEVERLHELLSGRFDAVRVIVYLRRQDEFLLSSYSTAVKSGIVQKLWLPKVERELQRYDFAKILGRWSDVFGRDAMEVRLFNRSTMVDGNVVADFIHATGLPPDLPYEMPNEENRSLDSATLEVLRLMNKHLPYTKDGEIFHPRADLHVLMEAIASGASVTMDPVLLDVFMQSFAESNRKVAREYFGQESAAGDPLFGPLRDRANRKAPEPISVETAVEIFAKLWTLKHMQMLQSQ